jgi:hypothetical protein
MGCWRLLLSALPVISMKMLRLVLAIIDLRSPSLAQSCCSSILCLVLSSRFARFATPARSHVAGESG